MKILTLMVLFFSGGCGVERLYENYQIVSVSDLYLTQTNHPHGYSKTQCFTCHNPSNIHQVDRLGAPSFSLAKPLIQQSGLASCSGCHGSNGVP